MELHWEDDYAIALALRQAHPGVNPLEVEWATLHQWIIELPDFADDRSVTALYLLENIQCEWYEEVASHESS
ncbi:Protein IscX [Thermoflexales bacterium]|nr:Protein IscX [Thermoflexales bacterium]